MVKNLTKIKEDNPQNQDLTNKDIKFITILLKLAIVGTFATVVLLLIVVIWSSIFSIQITSLKEYVLYANQDQTKVLGASTKNDSLLTKAVKTVFRPFGKFSLWMIKLNKSEDSLYLDPLEITNINDLFSLDSKGNILFKRPIIFSDGTKLDDEKLLVKTIWKNLKDRPLVVSSLDGVSNDSGNIDLIEGNNIKITGNDDENTLTISSTLAGTSLSTTPTSLAAGVGISVSGSFPNFTVLNTDRGSGQIIFKTISVAGQSDIAADNNSDTLTFSAGSGITLTTSAILDTLTIAAAGGGDSDTLDTFHASQFLRSDTPNSFTSGILTIAAGTTLDVLGTFTCTNCIGDAAVVNTITASNYLPLAGGTIVGAVNMGTNVINNIGNAGTDFTANGGLTLADILTVSSGGASITGGLNLNSGGITNTGAIAGATSINASGTITGNILTNGTITITGGALTGGTTAAFGTSVTSTLFTGTAAVTLSSGVGALNLDSASGSILIATGDSLGIGATDPGSILDINGALTARGMSAPSLSPAGQGRIYFDSGSNVFKVSENGGNYANLVGSGGHQIARVVRTAGDYTTTSTTFVDIDTDNLVINMTTGDSWVLLTLTGSAYITSFGYVQLDFTIDDVRQGQTKGVQQLQATYVAGIQVAWLVQVTAGSHVFRPQWRVSTGSALLRASAAETPLLFAVTELKTNGGGSQTPWTSNINASGYTLYGNETASGNLTLESTSDVAKGYVLLNSNSGNVGIGTTSPDSKVQITGGGLCVGSDVDCNSDNNIEGYVYAAQTAITVYDVAENYPTKDETLEAGEVVSLDQDNAVFVKRSSLAYDSNLIGVISTEPAVLLGGFKTEQSQFLDEIQVPVALTGRVPVKVSTENGPIQPGDPLTSSSTSGVAMKATQSGPIVGKALESYDNADPTAIGKIMVFVSVGWYVQPLDTSGQSLGTNLTSIDTEMLSAGTISTQILIIGGKELKVNEDGVLWLEGSMAIAGDLNVEGVLSAKKVKTDELEVSDKSSGKDFVVAGTISKDIKTDILKERSKVFITFTSDYSPATRYWVTKKIGESFTVHLDQPPNGHTSLDWLVVN